LVIQCIWHGVIGAVIYLNTPDNRVTPSMQMVHIDQYVFFIVLGIFFAMHIALLIWLYLVPLRHRKNMKKKDIQYQLSLTNKKTNRNNNNSGKESPPFSRIPIET
jgi:H+/Cl- antiporter ClcA